MPAGIVLVVDEPAASSRSPRTGTCAAPSSAGGLDDPLAPVANEHFVAVDGAVEGRRLDLMRGRRIAAIPVVDADGRPVALHQLQGFLRHGPRGNRALIMAGGLGTRLRPLTEDVPKPMLRVAGRPILERIVLHLVGFGIEHISISVGYLAEVIEAHFGDGEAFGATIDYLREDEPLGTAGALGLLPAPPTAPLLVVNGDLVTSVERRRDAPHARRGRVRRHHRHPPLPSTGFRSGASSARGHGSSRSRRSRRCRGRSDAGMYVVEPWVVGLVATGRTGVDARRAVAGHVDARRDRRGVRGRRRLARRRPARAACAVQGGLVA